MAARRPRQSGIIGNDDSGNPSNESLHYITHNEIHVVASSKRGCTSPGGTSRFTMRRRRLQGVLVATIALALLLSWSMWPWHASRAANANGSCLLSLPHSWYRNTPAKTPTRYVAAPLDVVRAVATSELASFRLSVVFWAGRYDYLVHIYPLDLRASRRIVDPQRHEAAAAAAASENVGRNKQLQTDCSPLGLDSDELVVAHQKRAGLSPSDFTARALLHPLNFNSTGNATNTAMFVMADELNLGSSYLAVDPSPWSYVVRDYYFDKLRDAEQTRVVQLGTLSCRRGDGSAPQWPCDVSPPSVVFVAFLRGGIKDAFLPDSDGLVKASQRPVTCYWAGSDRWGRLEMYTYFRDSGECDVVLTDGFGQGDNHTVYVSKLMRAAFGLVPRGNSPETHRLAEIIQTGGIPAMIDQHAKAPHMTSYAFPMPVVSGPTWRDVGRKMAELARDPVRLDAMQSSVMEWWERHWSCVRDDMRWIVAQAHARSHGRDLCPKLGG